MHAATPVSDLWPLGDFQVTLKWIGQFGRSLKPVQDCYLLITCSLMKAQLCAHFPYYKSMGKWFGTKGSTLQSKWTDWAGNGIYEILYLTSLPARQSFWPVGGMFASLSKDRSSQVAWQGFKRADHGSWAPGADGDVCFSCVCTQRKVAHAAAFPTDHPTNVQTSIILHNHYNWATSWENLSCHMQTTKVQISLRIRAVWSVSVVHCLDSIIPLVLYTNFQAST